MRADTTCRTASRITARALRPLIALVMLAGSATADDGDGPAPWPREVPDHIRPAPGEHPRLFFRRSDLPDLRRRAATPEGKAIVRRLEELVGVPAEAGSGDLAPDLVERQVKAKRYTMSHAAGYGLLYQLTGDRRYAALGRKAFELALEGARDRDERYSFREPKGALRAGPSGADAMLVMTGPGAGEGTTVELGDRRLSFLFVSRGEEPTPVARGDAVRVGDQTVGVDADGNLVLETMAQSPAKR